ncbi:hypothetical protein BC831DRAFT_456166 [Entophlyctis helioformis]|nr:hypothetical protein BC831DRAFT_456166 [Entophlyctis helioformis]
MPAPTVRRPSLFRSDGNGDGSTAWHDSKRSQSGNRQPTSLSDSKQTMRSLWDDVDDVDLFGSDANSRGRGRDRDHGIDRQASRERDAGLLSGQLAAMDDIAAMSAVAVPIEINEMLEQLHRFAHNVKRSGGIAETFLCGIPDSEEDGGLSIGVKNQCIFFGSRLKSKIFQLVALYNAYFQHMGMAGVLFMVECKSRPDTDGCDRGVAWLVLVCRRCG